MPAPPELHIEIEGDGPRLVLVHGFTQTGRSWGPVGAELSRDYQVVHIDAPGHGGSANIATDLPGGARLIGEVGGPAIYLGYSMGARYCLHVALAFPRLVEALIMVGGTAGMRDEEQRRLRRRSDEALAAGLERDGLEAFLQRWLANPLFAGLGAETNGLAARRENTVAGLASSLRLAGTGTQHPQWDHLADLDMPVLAVAGEADHRFADLAAEMVTAIGPNAEMVLVPDAGHSAHLEQPEAFLAAIGPFLQRVRAVAGQRTAAGQQPQIP